MLATLSLSIALSFAQPWFVNSAIQNQNAIQGRVATPDDKPLENARVTLLTDRMSQVGVVYTDSSGRFNFRNLARGIYSILVEPGGGDYERLSKEIDINAFAPSSQGGSEVFRVDFTLRPLVKKIDKAGGDVVFYQEVPDAAKKQYDRSLDSLKKGDFKTAVESLKRALETFPDYYDALELLGTEYVKRGEYQPALPVLTHAVEINRNDWRSFYALGITLTELKRPGEAIEHLRRAVELNPNSPHANMRLGIALAQDEATCAEAIETFKKAILLGVDGIPEIYLHLASLYARNRQYREAAEAMEFYLKAAPQSDQREYYEKLLKQLRQKASEDQDGR